jgi:methionine-S-sulfoxide reductase
MVCGRCWRPLLVCAAALAQLAQGASRPAGPAYLELLRRPDLQSEQVREEKATFAAGCFWSVELAFQRLPGVLRTAVGYIGGKSESPSYRAVSSGRSGHAEAVEVVFDPSRLAYEELLAALWDRHDPTTLNRQANDVGTQYRSGIYAHSPEQAAEARKSLAAEQARLGVRIVTEIVEPAPTFWPAEDYHQQYLEKGGQTADKGAEQFIKCYG